MRKLCCADEERIGNALKHTSHGPVAVQVRHAKGRLVIDVADEGPGIPQESHEKVFEPFYRGSSGTPALLSFR